MFPLMPSNFCVESKISGWKSKLPPGKRNFRQESETSARKAKLPPGKRNFRRESETSAGKAKLPSGKRHFCQEPDIRTCHCLGAEAYGKFSGLVLRTWIRSVMN